MSCICFVLLRTQRQIIQCIYSETLSHFPLSLLIEECCVILTADVVGEARARSGFELQLIEAEVLSVPQAASPIVINQERVALKSFWISGR